MRHSDQQRIRIGQAICTVCGKPARPGSAIVQAFGAGGRVHIGCVSQKTNCAVENLTTPHTRTVTQRPVPPTNKV